MVGFGAVPAILQLSTIRLLPESREMIPVIISAVWDILLIVPARILMVNGQLEAAERILARIHPWATPSQLDTKVALMAKTIHLDNTLQGAASLRSKLDRLLLVSSNRRALGTSLYSAH